MSKVVLVGYSGHAFVATDILLLNQHEIVGYFENLEKEFNPYNLKFLGSEKNIDAITSQTKQSTNYCLGLGDNHLRMNVDSFLLQFPWHAITLIHPRSLIASHVRIGEGSLVSAAAVVNPLTQIGRACIVNTAAVIEHECIVADYAHIAPGAVLAGNVKVGKATFVGANSIIKQGIKIGDSVTIGAGSVVLNDIPNNQTWAGNPAKFISNKNG